jgi:hypothetical protein
MSDDARIDSRSFLEKLRTWGDNSLNGMPAAETKGLRWWDKEADKPCDCHLQEAAFAALFATGSRRHP